MKIMESYAKATLLVLMLVALYGCAGYNKLLKDPNAEKRYRAALKYYGAEKYAKSTPLFETLDIPFNGHPQEDSAKFYAAKGYYLLNDNYSAEANLEQFIRLFGRSVFAEEASYLRAVNLYKMTARPELDQTNTIDAITAFRVFDTKFPESKMGKDKDYLSELIDRLERKSYLSAKLYYQIEDYKAAVIALRNSVKEFPNSKYREELSFLVLKSSYVYAKRSVRKRQTERYIATIDEYYNFISEYPESRYTGEAEGIYADAVSYTRKRGINLKDEIDNKNIK